MTDLDTPWWLRGDCTDHPDPDMFFTTSTTGVEARAAKAVCNGCPVRMDCARDAHRTGEHFAVRAGFHTGSHRERQRMRVYLGLEQSLPRRPVTQSESRVIDPADPIAVVCPCGVTFQATRRTTATRCKPCRDDLVPVDETRARMLEVYSRVGSYNAVAIELGLNREQVRRVVVDGYTHVKRYIAEQVLGIAIAKAS